MSTCLGSHVAKTQSDRHAASKTGLTTMTAIPSDLKQAEEAKRERNWDAAQRWKVLQDTITWAEQQATVRRNTPAACLANQQRILALMAKRAAARQP